jgi:surfactin synthase thioesterase subunit
MSMLIRPLGANASVRLFCLPCAGGSAQTFRTWIPHVPPDVEIVPLELRGRGTRFRELPDTRLQGIVAETIDTVMGAADRPFALFGHSMGALAAFEVARALAGEANLRHLFVTAYPSPDAHGSLPQLHQLTDAALLAHLRSLDSASVGLHDDELMRAMLPIVRADLTACEQHRPLAAAGPVRCALTATGGDSDPLVTADALRRWRDHTTGTFRVQTFPGGHFFFNSCLPTFVATLVADLREAGQTAPLRAR